MKKQIFTTLLLGFIIASCSSSGNDAETDDFLKELDAELAQIDKEEEEEKKAEKARLDALVADSIASLEIKGFKLTKVSGSSSGNEVKYQNLWSTIEEAREEGKKNMDKPSSISSKIDTYKEIFTGGRVWLNISRLTDGVAEAQYFTCIIQDMDGNELYRKTAPRDYPNYYSGKYHNTMLFGIDKQIPQEFKLFIVDKFAKEPLVYDVKAIK